MKESISDNRLIGECMYIHRQWSIHAVYLSYNWTSSELHRRNAMLTIHFTSIQFKYNIQH